MKADRVIAAEMTATLAGYVAQDVIGQPTGQRTFPSPKIVVGVLAFFGMLSWVAALGTQAARVASAVGAVVTLVFLMRPAVTVAIERTGGGLVRLLDFVGNPGGTPSSQAPAAPSQAPVRGRKRLPMGV